MAMESTADAQRMQDALPNRATTATNNSSSNTAGNSHHRSSSEALYQSADGAPSVTGHRRGYQACDPCRKRKVKCDLGSVDNPRPPPCVRCRRESKRCEFSATRRKRKASDADQDPDGPLRRDRRMMVGEVSYSESPSVGSTGNNNDSPYAPPPTAPAPAPTPAAASTVYDTRSTTKPQWADTPSSISSTHRSGSIAQKDHYQPNAQSATNFRDPKSVQPPGSYPMPARVSAGIESRQHVMNKTAADLLFPTISNSHDALHLLSEAAGRTEDLNRQNLENHARQSASSYGGHLATGSGEFSRHSRHPYPKTENSTTAAEGYASSHNSDYRKHGVSAAEDPGYLDAVKAWSRLRFVRAGWLSVEEAMAYIAYYYKHLAPLSPIVIPDFSPPSTHRALLTDEPVLAVAMLTTASRHMKPKGDGSHTRGYYIHDRLWAYLRGMIERLFWGQEKFAGNSVGMSTPRSLDIGPPASASLRGNLRSLGTVEALLILTDWHPRNLHFPPGDDENTLLDTDALLPSQNRGDGDGEGRNQNGGGLEGRLAFQKWLEPTWRSDRMSWMLLSTAQALAFELGVFDLKDPGGQEPIEEQMRKRRVRRLIIVYITQSSGRLGIPSMLPLDKWSGDIEPLSPKDASDVDLSTDRMQDLWVQISRIMSLSNSDLFPSKEKSSELIQTGRYKERIAEFIPRLQQFKMNMESVPLSPQMRNILSIEYEYTRVYVNCLALQAVVERWTSINNEPSNKSSASGSLRVLMELYRVNERYIQEVVDASRRILTIVLEGLVPGDHLKHCPVRTFFRILSGMIFILKTFTLGATEDDVRVSLALQDRTIEALRTCVVDDVHLSNTISRLLELLTTNIRTRFLRFAPTDRGADGEGQERNSQPDSRLSSPRPTKDNPQLRREVHSQWPYPQNTGNNVNYPVDHGQQPVTSYHDPLASIPAQPINSSNIGVSFMPPPPSVYHSYYDPNDTPPKLDETASMVHEGGLPDWFALPLDQFFNSSAGTVDQGLGGTGPMLGEFDMLEVLLNEHYDKDGNANGAADSADSHNNSTFM